MKVGICVAVPINRHDPIRIFRYHFPIRIHAEGSDHIVVSVRLIYDFPFINGIGNVFKNFCRKFYSDTNVNTILLLFNSQFVANLRNPL